MADVTRIPAELGTELDQLRAELELRDRIIAARDRNLTWAFRTLAGYQAVLYRRPGTIPPMCRRPEVAP